MWQFGFEIASLQAISALDPAKDIKACHRARHTLALNPRQQGLRIKGFVYANDRPVELPVTLTKAAHLIGECIGE